MKFSVLLLGVVLSACRASQPEEFPAPVKPPQDRVISYFRDELIVLENEVLAGVGVFPSNLLSPNFVCSTYWGYLETERLQREYGRREYNDFDSEFVKQLTDTQKALATVFLELGYEEMLKRRPLKCSDSESEDVLEWQRIFDQNPAIQMTHKFDVARVVNPALERAVKEEVAIERATKAVKL